MHKIKIALDWTPNVNHIGLFVAKELGFYQDSSIVVQIINPLEDNYSETPGKKLELDKADFAIAPFETVISLNNKQNLVDAIAVYAILQEDISSIATLKTSGINSPKELDHKVYASYKARYEDHIVTQVVKNDGGKGILNITYPNKLGIWNTLLNNQADATWIFDNWEGIEAAGKGIALNKFALKDYQIPYGYSPVIIAKASKIAENHSAYFNFIQATKKGYLYAIEHPKRAAEILSNFLTPHDRENINILDAISYTAKYIGNPHTCGTMQTERINAFLTWLVENGIESQQILKQHLFSNDLITG
jgi:ABC-type nitrate/sulfonate/bicarbonate transport system substrate-binding protein